jgi:hypothetical protein
VPEYDVSGESEGEIADHCREQTQSAGCAWQCTLYSLRWRAHDRARLAAFFLEELPSALEKKPECKPAIPDAAPVAAMIDCLGDETLPVNSGWVTAQIELDEAEPHALRAARMRAKLHDGFVLHLSGQYRPGGCGTGPAWSTYLGQP